MISTDLASRGLDVEHVGRVINYHLPKQMENYLHRVGRTARAGRPGLVINFVTERDEDFIKKLDAVRSVPKALHMKAPNTGANWPEAPTFKKRTTEVEALHPLAQERRSPKQHAEVRRNRSRK